MTHHVTSLKLNIRFFVAICIVLFTSSAFASEQSALEEKLANEGFDVAKMNAKVHPDLIAALEGKLQDSFHKGLPASTVRIDVRLRNGEQNKAGRQALKTKSGLDLRKARVKAAQENIWKAMEGLYGLDRFNVKRRFESFYGFTADADDRAVAAIAGLDDVVEISLVERLYPDDTEALALTTTSLTQSIGLRGAGVTIAVIDGGIDYTHGAFGGYSNFPNAKVVGGTDLANNDNDPMADCSDDDHGTASASVAAGNGGGVTGSAPLASLVHVKIDDDCTNAWAGISSGIDWVVSNYQSTDIDIVTMSMSNSSEYGAYCDSSMGSGLLDDLQTLREVGIPFFSSASNDNNKSGIAKPSCSSHIISVGAVYDANIGSRSYCGNSACTTTLCTDSSTSADQVTCYSNSASILDMLGPADCYKAAKAGGGTKSCYNGTSAATPFVAGAAASILQGTPWLTREGLIFALKEQGINVTDSANGVTTRRVTTFHSFAAAQVPVSSYLLMINNIGTGEGEVLYRFDERYLTTRDINDLNGAQTCAADIVQATDDGMLYGIGCENTSAGTSFFSMDPTTGYTTDIASFWGDETALTSLAYDSANDVLYGMNMHQQYRGKVLVTIDRTTGETTEVGSLSGDRSQATSIAFDNNGVLYGINSSGWGMGSVLFTINPATAQTTDVGSLSGAYNKASSIRVNADGIMYAIDWNGTTGGVGTNLYRINTNNASTTHVMQLSGDRTHATALAVLR